MKKRKKNVYFIPIVFLAYDLSQSSFFLKTRYSVTHHKNQNVCSEAKRGLKHNTSHSYTECSIILEALWWNQSKYLSKRNIIQWQKAKQKCSCLVNFKINFISDSWHISLIERCIQKSLSLKAAIICINFCQKLSNLLFYSPEGI